MLVLVQAPSRFAEAPAAAVPVPASEQTFAADRFLPPDDPTWPGHWAKPPEAWGAAHARGAEALERARTAIAGMPAELRQVIVLRDVEERSPEGVREALGLTPEEERAMLHQARGIVRADLERYFEQTGRDDER
jgi:DNA-directed RNA polymerase specialized sigma24 family protein